MVIKLKKRLIELIANAKMYNGNSNTLPTYEFGLDINTVYDLLVVAPGWKPNKIIEDPSFEVKVMKEHSYISGYEVLKDGYKIGWIQIGSGACNTVDKMIIASMLKFKKVVFLGAVGSLKEELHVGDICTPLFSVNGSYANAYLKGELSNFKMYDKVVPHNKKFIDEIIEKSRYLGTNIKYEGVYCTDSYMSEYSHLDFIKSFDVGLVEMETSTFYVLAEMLEIPAIALLVVSDNLATREALKEKTVDQQKRYNHTRCNVIPNLLMEIIKL